MNSDSPNHVEVQIDTPHRAKKMCQPNTFKTLQVQNITKQVSMATDALHEERKFFKYLGCEL